MKKTKTKDGEILTIIKTVTKDGVRIDFVDEKGALIRSKTYIGSSWGIYAFELLCEVAESLKKEAV